MLLIHLCLGHHQDLDPCCRNPDHTCETGSVICVSAGIHVQPECGGQRAGGRCRGHCAGASRYGHQEQFGGGGPGSNDGITVKSLSPSDVDYAFIMVDTGKTITADRFNRLDVTTRGVQNSD